MSDAPKTLADDKLREAIGRAWCHEENVAKEMDADLAEAVLWEIRAALAEQAAPAGVPEWDYFQGLVNIARRSAAKAKIKFPQPNYVTLKIAEEAGEVVRGAVHYAEGRMEWDDVQGEIIQLLAMLIRFVTEGDEVNGVIPPELVRRSPLALEPDPTPALQESPRRHPMALATWQTWIDDLPLPDDFDEGKEALQEYLYSLAFPDPTPALSWRAMQTAAKASILAHSETARRRMRAAHDGGDAESYDNWSAIVSHLDTALDAILALPGPTDAQLLADAMKLPEVQAMREALADIARQKNSAEMDIEFGDVEGGYDACISVAREALAKIGGAA